MNDRTHMSEEPKVFIIILTWNNLQDTADCLESVKNLHYGNYEIILVDNGSTDGSITVLENKYPDITLIKNADNVGFALGNNRGMEKALEWGCDFVFLLNNDTTLDKDCLSELVRCALSYPTVGIVGPKISLFSEPSIVWYGGGDIVFREAISVNKGYFKKDRPAYNAGGEVTFVSGCAMLVRRKAIDEVGLFDPIYVSYMEDTDWCWRMAKKGFKLAYVPAAKVYHKVSQSFGIIPYNEKSMYLMGRNAVLFVKKYGNFVCWFKFIFFFWLSVLYALPRELMRGNQKAVLAKIRGFVDGMKGGKQKLYVG